MFFISILLCITSTTAINNNGLRALPCMKPTITSKCPYISDPHNNLLICPFYLSDLSVWNPPASMMPSSFLSVWNNTRSMNSVIISSYHSSFFSLSCLVANIPFVVPLSFLNPCCASPISPSTNALFLPYKLFSCIFNKVVSVYFPNVFHIASISPLLHPSGIFPHFMQQSFCPTFSSSFSHYM